jgi:uncharacterized protein YbjT (DUF2867 family)
LINISSNIKMHIILTGATGLVGSGVLDALLKASDVTRISILSRRPVPMVQAVAAADPRVNVILHSDFSKYDDQLLEKLRGAQGCVWALGISQTKVKTDEEYIDITKTYALAAAEALSKRLPRNDNDGNNDTEPFRFVYVSGEGATQTPGIFTPLFGRVKGETEAALAAMPSPSFVPITMRPAGVDPTAHAAIQGFAPAFGTTQRVAVALTQMLWSGMLSPTEPLGVFLRDLAMGKVDSRPDFEGKGVSRIRIGGGEEEGGFVVGNAGFRRLMGL